MEAFKQFALELKPIYINLLQGQPNWIVSEVSYPLQFGVNMVTHENIPNCLVIKDVDFRKFPKDPKAKKRKSTGPELLLWSFDLFANGKIIHRADLSFPYW